MRFSIAFTALLSALAIPAVVASRCRVGRRWRFTDNCCWGRDALSCSNQNSGSRRCLTETETANYCSKVQRNGEPVSKTCDADCCDTTTGWGIACPDR
ncbi:hypothetical protein Cob_v008213 [Colletotrichum orbiculare MAFF 240422]|uniref:Uncharacterized protein n=1 Tax=Colletotrichum orbiculare (strain 104-T / ATCC 96160 / CBS 514.97 / LARS 414 / MAFF 240422) TaxID=1213857 RepID=A0A484FM30_COLOR|nr:hypothetical protein Cob_v008213 [Colletotrichum orbiculare MAFF 240422]